MNSKLDASIKRRNIRIEPLVQFITTILNKTGCNQTLAAVVARHLVEAEVRQNEKGGWIVDGNRGIGIPAMNQAMRHGCELAKANGISATALVNCGHTGRLGAFAEWGARQGCLNIIIGGSSG